MSPLNAVVIGDHEDFLPRLRCELLNLDVEIVATFKHANEVQTAANWSAQDLVFFLVEAREHLQEHVSALHGRFADRPIVIFAEEGCSVAELSALTRLGACQILQVPLVENQLKESIECLELQFAGSHRGFHSVAVTGAIGGVGATAIAANLAYEIAQLDGYDTTIADLSLSRGALASYFNIEPKYTISDLIRNQCADDAGSFRQAIVEFSEHLGVLTSNPHTDPVEWGSPREIKDFIRALGPLSKFLVMDVPTSLTETHPSLTIADLVILVTDQTIPALSATLDLLNDGLRSQGPVVVVNRFSDAAGIPLPDVRKTLEFDDVHIVRADYRAMQTAVNSGMPLRLLTPSADVLVDIAALAQVVEQRCGLPAHQQPQGQSLPRRLLNLLWREPQADSRQDTAIRT